MKPTLKTEEVIKTVKKNRKTHNGIFKEALEGYRGKAIAMLNEHIDRIKKGKVEYIRVFLEQPVDHTRDYDRVLSMLEHHEGTTIDLTEEDYTNYVLDDWSWKREFLTTNSYYSATAAASLQEDE